MFGRIDPVTALKLGFDALHRNRVRSLLAVLGVVIGVGAVIAMVSLGKGAEKQVQDSIAAMGSNVLFLRSGSSRTMGLSGGGGSSNSLSVEDVEAIARECPAIKAVSPSIGAGAQIVFGNQNWQTRVEGASAAFPEVRNWKVVAGEFFADSDVRTAGRVAVIGQTIVTNLFAGIDPIGQTIRLRNLPFRVVGVLERKGENQWGRDQDDTVLVPYTTVLKKMLATTWVQGATLSAISAEATSTAERQVSELLRQRHRLGPNDPDDFTVRNMTDVADTMEATQKVWTLLLGGIAGVSLVVGGIGIMNIMLVSVTERTREIGVRRALGARKREVRLQFLSESVMLCLTGGVVGVLLGIGLAQVFARAFQWPAIVSPAAAAGAVLFAALVGVGFGYYPAHKASSLDPVEALRYE